MKAAVIGLGVGVEHVKAYREMGVEVTAVIDRDKDLRERIAGEFGVSNTASSLGHFSDLAPGLKEADIVSICSYDQFHFEQTKIFWELGKHVIVEKPPCLRLDHFAFLKELIASRPQSYMCNLPLPFHPPFADLAAIDFGDIYLMEAAYNWGRVHKLRDGWRADCPGYSVVFGAGLHMIDLMIWLKERRMDDGSALGCGFNGFANHDTVVAACNFSDKSVASLVINCGYEGEHSHRLNVWGTKTGRMVTNTDPVDKGAPVRKFVELLGKGRLWDNTRLWHAMEVCFEIERHTHG